MDLGEQKLSLLKKGFENRSETSKMLRRLMTMSPTLSFFGGDSFELPNSSFPFASVFSADERKRASEKDVANLNAVISHSTNAKFAQMTVHLLERIVDEKMMVSSDSFNEMLSDFGDPYCKEENTFMLSECLFKLEKTGDYEKISGFAMGTSLLKRLLVLSSAQMKNDVFAKILDVLPRESLSEDIIKEMSHQTHPGSVSRLLRVLDKADAPLLDLVAVKGYLSPEQKGLSTLLQRIPVSEQSFLELSRSSFSESTDLLLSKHFDSLRFTSSNAFFEIMIHGGSNLRNFVLERTIGISQQEKDEIVLCTVVCGDLGVLKEVKQAGFDMSIALTSEFKDFLTVNRFPHEDLPKMYSFIEKGALRKKAPELKKKKSFSI